jgi:hypothetical protein
MELESSLPIHKISPLVPILSQIIPVHPTPPRSILILYIDLSLGLPSRLFPSAFPINNLYTYTYPAYLILFDLIILIILDEEYKL